MALPCVSKGIRAMLGALLLVAGVSELTPRAAAAQASGARPLQNTEWWALTAEFAGAVLVGFAMPDLLYPSGLGEPSCDSDAWCDTNGFDRGIQDALAPDDAKPWATASHVFTLGITPALAFGSAIVPALMEGNGWYAVQDSVIILNAFLLSTGFNSLAKVGAKRQRPAYHYGREAHTEVEDRPREEFVSFFSGDATWAFALAGSAATLAYLRDRSLAPLVLIVAGTTALVGSVLRVVADVHWATDVLTGMAVGSAVGAGLPLLLHCRADASLQVAPRSDGGLTLGVTLRM